MSSDDRAVEVVVTAPDQQWLRQFIRELVAQHLCAAGHLYPFETIYHRQGDIYERTETRGALYTRASLVERLTERIRREHPYQVPHVTATPLTIGNADYLQWILTETARA